MNNPFNVADVNDIIVQSPKEMDYPICRDDLLHKRNLEYFNEQFRKIKVIGSQLQEFECVIKDIYGYDLI
jgi:hypothetical protein